MYADLIMRRCVSSAQQEKKAGLPWLFELVDLVGGYCAEVLAPSNPYT
jgi:hypothetical protein